MNENPLKQVHFMAAARLLDEGGPYEIPANFLDPEGEYRATRTDCGLADLSNRGKILIEGADARKFLHGLCTSDITGLEELTGCYTALTDIKGKMIADARVMWFGDRLLLDVEPSVTQAVLEHLDKYTVGADATVRDLTAEIGTLTIQGPASPRVLSDLFGDQVSPLDEMEVLETDFDEEPLFVVGSSFTGEIGFDLLAPKKTLADLWETLLDTGAGMRPVGMNTLEMLRVEAGIPRFLHDMDQQTIPLEANLERAVSFNKGCYLGQEVIAKIRDRGRVNRQLTGLLLPRGELPNDGTPIYAGDKNVGKLTSRIDSPALGRPIALGYVHRDHRETGTQLRLEGGGEAEVTPLPFVEAPRLKASS